MSIARLALASHNGGLANSCVALFFAMCHTFTNVALVGLSGNPAPRKAAVRRTLHWHALVDVSPDGLLIAERPATGLWARMHQPPTVESAQPLDEAAQLEVVEVGHEQRDPRRELGVTEHDLGDLNLEVGERGSGGLFGAGGRAGR